MMQAEVAAGSATLETAKAASCSCIGDLWGVSFRVARKEGLAPADAEDVASLTLMDFLEVSTDIVNEIAWIHLVTRRKAWAHRRRISVRSRLLDAHQEQLNKRMDVDAASVELLVDLSAALSSLEDVERYAVLSADLKGEALAEIALATGLSVETIKRRLRHGRQSLKRILSGHSLRCSLRASDVTFANLL